MKKKPKVVTIFGTRPEAIKMAPVVLELAKRADEFDSQVCLTSQHDEMLKQVMDVFELKADHDLKIMKPNQDLFDVTIGVLDGIKKVITEVKPDLALVHGDTTTTFAASLACFYCNIPVGHVEAGLRTGDKRQPFPEEINRRLADAVCDVHYAPTETNRDALLAEGTPAGGIVITGNTVIDALLGIVPKAREVAPTIGGLENVDWNLNTILVTCHRRESFGDQMRGICEALKTIAERLPDANLIFPVHYNPNVRRPVNDVLGDVDRVYLIDPLEYLPFVYLMDRCHLVLTDSGGIQEEAPALDKPVLVMRNKTERMEVVDSGAALLVGTEGDKIVEQVISLYNDKETYAKMAAAKNPYGDGTASQKIADDILRRYS